MGLLTDDFLELVIVFGVGPSLGDRGARAGRRRHFTGQCRAKVRTLTGGTGAPLRRQQTVPRAGLLAIGRRFRRGALDQRRVERVLPKYSRRTRTRHNVRLYFSKQIQTINIKTSLFAFQPPSILFVLLSSVSFI